MDAAKSIAEAIERWKKNIESKPVKKCACGEEYWGAYNLCPECLLAEEEKRLKASSKKVDEAEEVLEAFSGEERRSWQRRAAGEGE